MFAALLCAALMPAIVEASVRPIRSLPLCTNPPIVATIAVVDGMPFITPRRRTVRVLASSVGGGRRAFAIVDGRESLARLSFASDGSIQVTGRIAVTPGGMLLRVITDRPGHCIIRDEVIANSAPAWHLVAMSSPQ